MYRRSSDALPLDEIFPFSFEIDMNTGTITVIYEQPVLGTTLNTSKFTLQDAKSNPATLYSLTGGKVSSAVDTRVTITLSETDLNQIKQKPVCDAKAAMYVDDRAVRPEQEGAICNVIRHAEGWIVPLGIS